MGQEHIRLSSQTPSLGAHSRIEEVMITKEQIRNMSARQVQWVEEAVHEQWHEYCKDNTGTPEQQKIAEEALIELDQTWY